MTGQQLADMVVRRLGDRGRVWTEAEIFGYLVQAYRELVYSTRCVWDVLELDDAEFSDGVTTLPTNVIEIDRIEWDGKVIDAFSPRHLRTWDPRYESLQGEPIGYAWREEGPRTLRLIRQPNDDGTARIEHWRLGETVDELGDEFELPNRYALYLRDYALAKCYERAGPGQDPKLAKHYAERWARDVARITRRLATVDKDRVSRMGSAAPVHRMPASPTLPWQYGQRIRS